MKNLFPLISVLVPVFNAEKTLPKCLDSLEKQENHSFEVVLVDDCSSDSSFQLMKAFLNRNAGRQPIKLFRQPNNMGVAVTRNTCLSLSSGDYICWLDADDVLCPDLISTLIQNVRLSHADIIGYEWFLSFDKSRRYMRQEPFSTSDEAVTNFMLGVTRWNLWIYLVKRSLYIDYGISFLPGHDMGEDLLVMTKLFVKASHIAFVPKPLYEYRMSNSDSMTKTYSDKHRCQVEDNLNAMHCYLTEHGRSYLLKNWDNMKLFIKLPLLMSAHYSDYRKWYNWFPESNSAVMKNPKQSFRIKLLQWLAAKKFFFAIKCYYCLVYKLVYGVIYK